MKVPRILLTSALSFSVGVFEPDCREQEPFR
jgi:hypothetical protein